MNDDFYKAVAENAPVLIWMSGPDKLRIYVNKHWLDFTGRPVELELGDGWTSGIHRDDLEQCLSLYSECFDHRCELRMEYRLRRYDGAQSVKPDVYIRCPRSRLDGRFIITSIFRRAHEQG